MDIGAVQLSEEKEGTKLWANSSDLDLHKLPEQYK